MSLSRAKARSIIENFGIDDPVILRDHLEDLCFELGAAVVYQPMDGAEGRILVNGDNAVITINSNESNVGRKRFSIGHELGHFVLHRKEVVEFNCDNNAMNEWYSSQRSAQREVEANEFSIELLIPEKLAAPMVAAERPEYKLIESLSNIFNTSLFSAAIRYPELTKEPVAVIFYSKKGGVKVPKRSKLFNEQNYWFHSGPVDKESLAFDVMNGTSNYERPTSVAASAWLELPEYLQEELIMEQTRYFPKYDLGFSILWIKDGKLLRN